MKKYAKKEDSFLIVAISSRDCDSLLIHKLEKIKITTQQCTAYYWMFLSKQFRMVIGENLMSL
jgi:hypothetical protein